MPTDDTTFIAATDHPAAATSAPLPEAVLGPDAKSDNAAPPPVGDGADPEPAKAKKRKAQRRRPDDQRPVVTEASGYMPDALDKIEAALVKAGGLYQRGGLIVYPGRVAIKIRGGDRSTPKILERGEHALVEDISRAVCLMKYDSRADDDLERDPSSRLVQVLMARRDRLRLPVLAAIVTAPTLRPDGTLLDTPGFDPRTGLYFDPGTERFPPVPRAPSRDDALRALTELSALIAHFPFDSDVDRSVMLSGVLTALVRPSLDTAPLHGFSAAVPGSGKSKLVDVIAMIATGCEATVMTQKRNVEEFEKRLDAALLGGAAIISIDNCSAPLGGNALCAMLTQPFVEVRVFGTNTNVTIASTAFVTATGNNLTLAEDMPRRAVLCRIDPDMERPELRCFPFEPVSRARAGRGGYVAAGLTIMLAYVAAGRPHQVDPLGSFETWSDSVRSALMWLGCTDPCATMDDARQRDPVLLDCARVMAEWRTVIGSGPTTARELIAQAQLPAAAGPGFAHPGLREALLAVADRGGDINNNVFGRWLAGQAGRVVEGWRFNDVGVSNGSRRWQLREG